jgi:hypothetical protein
MHLCVGSAGIPAGVFDFACSLCPVSRGYKSPSARTFLTNYTAIFLANYTAGTTALWVAASAAT